MEITEMNNISYILRLLQLKLIIFVLIINCNQAADFLSSGHAKKSTKDNATVESGSTKTQSDSDIISGQESDPSGFYGPVAQEDKVVKKNEESEESVSNRLFDPSKALSGMVTSNSSFQGGQSLENLGSSLDTTIRIGDQNATLDVFRSSSDNSVTFSWLGLGPLILFSAHVNRRWPSSPSDQLLELSACCGGIMSILSGHKTTSSANKAFSFYLYFMRYFGNHRARHSIFLRCVSPPSRHSFHYGRNGSINYFWASDRPSNGKVFLLAINWSTSRYRFDQHASAS